MDGMFSGIFDTDEGLRGQLVYDGLGFWFWADEVAV